jgi:hypothetical protein
VYPTTEFGPLSLMRAAKWFSDAGGRSLPDAAVRADRLVFARPKNVKILDGCGLISET